MVFVNNDYYRAGGLYGYGYAFGYGRGFGSYHEGFVRGCDQPCYYGGGACNSLGPYYYGYSGYPALGGYPGLGGYAALGGYPGYAW